MTDAVVAHQVLTGIALMAVGIIYGTDAFCAVVQRSAMARVSADVLTSSMGYVHLYGDRRLRVPGAVGLLSTASTAVVAMTTDVGGAAAVSGAVAVVALLSWFVIYGRVSAPVNAKLTSAAVAGETPADARVLQRTWDSVINLRSALQAIALISLYLGVALT